MHTRVWSTPGFGAYQSLEQKTEAPFSWTGLVLSSAVLRARGRKKNVPNPGTHQSSLEMLCEVFQLYFDSFQFLKNAATVPSSASGSGFLFQFGSWVILHYLLKSTANCSNTHFQCVRMLARPCPEEIKVPSVLIPFVLRYASHLYRKTPPVCIVVLPMKGRKKHVNSTFCS